MSPWLETGVSGFYRLEDPESVMEGGDRARVWKGGRPSTLSPLMQAKAWGLSEARVPQVDIAAKLEKIGGGHPSKFAGGSPTGGKNRLTMLSMRRGERRVRFALACMRSSAPAVWRPQFFRPRNEV